jgi:hypothetical protein
VGTRHRRLKKLLSEELHDLHPSTKIIWVIKSRKIRWAGNVAGMGDSKVHARFRWKEIKNSSARK